MSFIKITKYCLAILVLVAIGCQEDNTLFEAIDHEVSGVSFINQITEDDSLNILVNEYVYNGAGVAIADLNGDGLQDLFFTGNQVDNRLYLNKGELKFEDITKASGISKPQDHYWSSGVNIVDINHDGLQDIYICNTMSAESYKRENLLYINQGTNADGIPSFDEQAKAYGLDSDTYSSHAQFFDYDNDGDIDVFIGVNQIYNNNPNQYANPIIGEEAISRDRLFQNNWDEALGHPVFKDVSEEAGIMHNGYSHSTLVHDFNSDGWLDLYVANDYISNDLVFINNQDGTFSNKASEIFKHFSLSAMGSDVGDINNDGKADFVTTEMQPFYNKRKKLFHGESSYTTEILRKRYNHEIQYTRNTLQLNLGNNPETNLPIYGDIGIMANVQETDWSWATLFADFDNDGWQDVYIANGFPKDVTDRDFSEFRVMASRLVSNEKLLEAIPEVKTSNFMFRNTGNLSFENVTDTWGIKIPSFTNGAAYGDLDNDGDLDLVTNNIDDRSFLFENKSNLSGNNYIRFKLKGPGKNTATIGAQVSIFYGDQRQVKNVLAGRGYLSQPETILHFGLGEVAALDSVLVVLPNGAIQKIQNLAPNQTHEILIKLDANTSSKENEEQAVFEEVAEEYGIKHLDADPDFIDFNIQRTIPHKLSQYGPSLVVGDINGDGLEDLLIGSGYEQEEKWFIQGSDGQFTPKTVSYKSAEHKEEDIGTLLFDADGDDDLDLYIVRGSAQFPDQHEYYRDVLLQNDGKGNFSKVELGIPDIRTSGSCVKAADYDQDGDLDLFVGSRVKPGSYPEQGRCYLLENQSTATQIKFVDNTPEDLKFSGLVSDASWTDINGDTWPDLIIASEWQPIQFYTNEHGSFVNTTNQSGVEQYRGWWNSLKCADLDNDGDVDLVAGNFGDNTYFKCSADEPIRIYGKDFDSNGSIDPVLSCMWQDSMGNKHEYPYHPYMDMGKQVVSMRKKFANYGEYGEASIAKILEDEDLSDAIQMSANYMKTSWIENLGSGKFKMHALPKEAQLAPVYGIQAVDANGDGNLDIMIVGNDHGVEVQQGRADASIGLLIQNLGKGSFASVSVNESSFFVPGDGRSLTSINVANEERLFVASQNKGSIKVFKNMNPQQSEITRLIKNEVSCIIKFKNDTKQKREFYWGDSFQSQASRSIVITPRMQSIKFYNNLGKESRNIDL